MTKKGNSINRDDMKRENRAYGRSRTTELMKAVKLHMWLAKEEITACVVMLGIGAVCFALMSVELTLALFGLVLFIIGMVYHEKALFKLFVVHRYGDAGTLIRMMPFDEAVTEKAARLIGGTLSFLLISATIGVLVTIWWGIYGFEFEKLFTVLEQLRMFGCEESRYSALLAKLPTELLFAAAGAICSVLGYECDSLLEERRSAEKGIAGYFKRSNAELRSIVLLVFFVALIVYAYMKTLPIPFLAAETVVLTVLGLAFAIIYRRLRVSENKIGERGKNSVKTAKRKAKTGNTEKLEYEAEEYGFIEKNREEIDERYTKLSRCRAYEALIAKKGYVEMPLSNLLPLVLVFYNLYKLTGENNSAYRFIIIAAVAAAFWILISAGKARYRCSEFLFDEYSAFYGMLPLSLKETAWVYTMTTFKSMLPILLLVWGIVTAAMFIPSVCEDMREALILLLGEPAIVSGTMGIVLLMLLWLLILIGLAFYLSGQALKIAIEASGSRDPITHKSSRTIAGLGETCVALAMCGIFIRTLPFEEIGSDVGSLIVLAILVLAGYIEYRTNISMLKEADFACDGI